MYLPVGHCVNSGTPHALKSQTKDDILNRLLLFSRGDEPAHLHEVQDRGELHGDGGAVPGHRGKRAGQAPPGQPGHGKPFVVVRKRSS